MKRIIFSLITLMSISMLSCNKEDGLKKIMTKVELNKQEASLKANTSLQLTAKQAGLETKATDFNWESSDKTIAEVSETGLVKALKDGETTIIVTAPNQSKDTCKIIVTNILSENVILNKAKLNLKIETNSLLVARVEGKDYKSTDYTWESSDKTIIIVTEEGLVKAVKEGHAIITVKAPNKTSATCDVIVTNELILITGFNIDSTEKDITIGDIKTLTTNILPHNATNQNVVWKSSANEIATINSKGILTAIKEGSVIITATIAEENKTASLTFNVYTGAIEITKITMAISEVVMDLENFTEKYLIVYYTPTTATDKTIKWKSSNTIVAEVTLGKVVAKTPGEAIITATTKNGITTSCKIIVKKPATTKKRFMIAPAITLTKKSGKYLNFVKFHEEDTKKEIVWTISATDKVDFKRDADGNVDTGDGCPILILKDAANTGDKATVTATMDGKTSECLVSVNKESDYFPVTGIKTNPAFVRMSKPKLRQYFFKFDKQTNEAGRRFYPTNTKVHCYIFDDTIVKANEKGDLTGLKVGTTKALVWSDDAGYGAFIEIEVEQ